MSDFPERIQLWPEHQNRESLEIFSDGDQIYDLADRLRFGSLQSEEEAEELESWVSFQLTQGDFALPVTHVRAIHRVGQITKIPGAPHPVRGAVNLRGRVLPLIDLNQRMGTARTELADTSRILVADSKSRSVGLLVDAVNRVLQLAPSTFRPPTDQYPAGDTNPVWKLVTTPERQLSLLNLDELLRLVTERTR